MALVENDPSSRMQRRSLGELMHPGSCCVCGNGNSEETYIELGVFYDYEGNLYMCTPCVEQLIGTFGGFLSKEVEDTLTKANGLVEENTRLKEEIDNVNSQLSALRLLLSFNPPSSDVVDPVSEESKQDNFTDSDVANVPDAGEPKTTEPVSLTGREDTSGTKPSNRKFV